MFNSALLVLEDGTQFQGRAIGATGLAVEVVFNTAMTGYQEVLTDPSYAQQIVTLTAPHIGNVGINSVDEESPSIYAKGLVIRDLSPIASNFRSQNGLSEYLKAHNVVAISEVDTRKLTRLLRDQGAQNGCIMAGEQDVETALANIRLFAGLKGVDLAKTVTTGKIYQWSQRLVDSKLSPSVAVPMFPYKVVVYDFGVKQRILQMLAERGCQLTVVPARTSAQTVLDMAPDGVFLSNGPGDPAACDYAISAIQQLLVASIPMFGICLGHQLLALACGATTQKMKFGHHGANHPVKDLMRNRVMITAQNHGFVVDAKTLPVTLKVTHQSLFDGTLQGIQHIEKPAFSFQGHPEASPGPQDAARLFDDFIELMAQYQKQAHFHALGA